jgi:uncharacterized protein YjbJ (UPF0337 family)
MSGVLHWESIERNWNAYQGNARGRWGLLTREDLAQIGGKRERLLARLRELYSLDEPQAEAQLAAWQAALRRVNPFT